MKGKNKDTINKVLYVLNLIKIVFFVLLVGIFIFQQMNAGSEILWTKYALIILAAIVLASLISSSILRKQDKESAKRVFIAILIIILVVLIFFVFNLDSLIFNEALETKFLIYILLGIATIVLITVYIIKIKISDDTANYPNDENNNEANNT